MAKFYYPVLLRYEVFLSCGKCIFKFLNFRAFPSFDIWVRISSQTAKFAFNLCPLFAICA
ncbi:hypothetical protein CAMGR0001_2172 [Campylobacter gracilis RM3268]|uniref:Uncharacterized protein n=1 Tax=Campylobacter gracilis RM3268 TaxID=553220 RepID=C8PGY4_9BACT|nr:hypothetical protein CAMGR0001_2172 [Campylobacter gracilis RM3268]